MQRGSAHLHPESPLDPLAQKWVDDLQDWYSRLQRHFNFDPGDLSANLRRSIKKWKRTSDPQRYNEIIANIEVGHKIPFSKKR